MTKNLAAFLLSFFIFSCAIKTPPVKNPATANQPANNSEKKLAAPENETVSDDFVQGSEDIPLLTEMNKIFDEGIGFDSADGSIMSSSYESNIGLERVKNFYSRTLPQLGWKQLKGSKDKLIFKREREKLEIEFTIQKGKDVVKFFISSVVK